MENDENKCKHEICICPKTAGSDYCSEYCKEADRAELTEISCGCPHPNC